MNDYKTYEELKEELGDNYDLFMYEINLWLLQKIDKVKEYIKENEKEYGSLLDNEKIILGIIEGDNNE